MFSLTVQLRRKLSALIIFSSNHYVQNSVKFILCLHFVYVFELMTMDYWMWQTSAIRNSILISMARNMVHQLLSTRM